jgi:hypothetical protein
MSWRIKTREEFFSEFGSMSKIPGSWNSSGQMDYLFGRHLSEDQVKQVREGKSCLYLPREDRNDGNTTWCISTSMITECKEDSIFSHAFHTEEEMKALYGEDWRKAMIGASWMKIMDNLLGKSMTKEEFDKIHESEHSACIYVSRAASPRLHSILSSTSLYIDKRIVNTGKMMSLFNDDMFLKVDQKY